MLRQPKGGVLIDDGRQRIVFERANRHQRRSRLHDLREKITSIANPNFRPNQQAANSKLKNQRSNLTKSIWGAC